MASSIGNIQKQIADADVNLQGLVAWLGTNGLESILSQMNDNTRHRGILVFESLSQLAVAGGADSQYAVAPDPNLAGGYNLYVFNPVIDSTISGAITSSSAGQWRPVFSKATPIERPFTTNTENDIIPVDDVMDSGMAIGQGNVDPNLWLDMPDKTSSGVAKGIRISSMTTSVMNSMATPPAWTLIVNKDSSMLLMQRGVVGFKSAGVYAGKSVSSLLASVFGIIVTIPTQHANDYKVYCTPTNEFTGALFQSSAWYITKLNDSFTIHFPAGTGTGLVEFDYQISH